MNKQYSLFMAWLLIFALGVVPTLAQTKIASAEKQAEFKKRVVDWGTNKQINVKLHSGEKISGRLAEIQDQYFAVQAVSKDGKVVSRQINYSDINKLSAKANAGNIVGYTALGVLAGVGVVVIVTIAMIAANE